MRKGLVTSGFVALLMVASTMAAVAGSHASDNALMMKWEKRTDVVHILVFDDDGRPGQPVAKVPGKSPILFGFEFGGNSVEDLEAILATAEAYLSIDGGPFESVKAGFQPPFVAVPGSGPRWSWDHDFDGLGDGNGNGIDDFDGPVFFWRYAIKHLSKGTHTFEFEFSFDGGTTFETDVITAKFG